MQTHNDDPEEPDGGGGGGALEEEPAAFAAVLPSEGRAGETLTVLFEEDEASEDAVAASLLALLVDDEVGEVRAVTACGCGFSALVSVTVRGRRGTFAAWRF